MSRRVPNLTLLAALALSPATLFPVSAVAQADVVWRRDLVADVEAWWLDLHGNLMVETPNGLMRVDPDSGRVRWVRPIPDSLLQARPLQAGHFLLVTKHAMSAVDTATGAPAWHREGLPSLAGDALEVDPIRNAAMVRSRNGIAMLDLATGATKWDSTRLTGVLAVRDAYWYRKLGVMLLVVRLAEREAAIITVSAEDGRIIGRTESAFTKPPIFKRYGGVESVKDWVNPLQLPDSGFVAWFSAEGPIRLAQDGTILWRAQELAGADIPASREGYPALAMLDSQTVVVAQKKQVLALSLADGRVAWRSAELRARPTSVFRHSDKLLIGGFGQAKSFMSLVDRADGRRAWPSDLEITSAASLLGQGDTLYLVDRNVFEAVPIYSGTRRVIGKVDFWGLQHPVEIDSAGQAQLLIHDRENLMLVGRDGRLEYMRYFKAPGASFMSKLASSALLVGLSAASMATASTTGFFLVPTGNRLLGARYGNAERVGCLWLAFTESPDQRGREGFSLVVVDRNGGKEVSRMWFADRSPDYRVGPLRGQVYVREGKTITARKFEQPLDVCPVDPEPSPAVQG